MGGEQQNVVAASKKKYNVIGETPKQSGSFKIAFTRFMERFDMFFYRHGPNVPHPGLSGDLNLAKIFDIGRNIEKLDDQLTLAYEDKNQNRIDSLENQIHNAKLEQIRLQKGAKRGKEYF